MQPEKCPECHQPLNNVEVRKTDVYKFNAEESSFKGTYGLDDKQESTVCPQCGADISEVFYPGDVRTYAKTK